MGASAWNPEFGNFLTPGKGSAGAGELPTAEEVFELRPAAWLRAVGGRETFHWDAPRLGGVVVKRQQGLRLADVLHDLVRGRRPLSPGRREYESLLALSRGGLRVPSPVAWFELSRGRRSAVVMECVEHRETLRERLGDADAAEIRALGRRALALVLGLHRSGRYHRDLYLQHFLLEERGRPSGGSEEPRLCLIDLERVRRGGGMRWRVKDLAALFHSCPERVGTRARLRFVAGWFDGMAIRGRARRRRLLRRVESKRARMAARLPRDERQGERC